MASASGSDQLRNAVGEIEDRCQVVDLHCLAVYRGPAAVQPAGKGQRAGHVGEDPAGVDQPMDYDVVMVEEGGRQVGYVPVDSTTSPVRRRLGGSKIEQNLHVDDAQRAERIRQRRPACSRATSKETGTSRLRVTSSPPGATSRAPS